MIVERNCALCRVNIIIVHFRLKSNRFFLQKTRRSTRKNTARRAKTHTAGKKHSLQGDTGRCVRSTRTSAHANPTVSTRAFLLQRRFGKSFPRRKAQRRQSDKQKQTQLSSFLHRQTRLTASPKNTLSLFPAEIQQNRNGDQCREADGSQRSGQNASFRRRFGNRFALRGRSGF